MSLFTAFIKTYRAGQMNRESTEKLQKKRLKALVRYAYSNSPYYQRLYAGLDSDFHFDFDLSDLPATDKVEMMTNLDDVFTDRNISVQRINDFTADVGRVGHMIDNQYLIFKTSGSTGNPATVLYDKGCIDTASAVAAFRTFARKTDYQSFRKNGSRTAGVFADYGFYLACGMSKYLQLKMPHKKNKINIDVNLPEDEIVQQLNAFQPAMLSGYPSNLSLLADFKELSINPDIVITGGELLTDSIRAKLTDKFHCYVQTHYSCTEAGEIACECSEGHLHINEDWVIVEPVDKENQPVAYGVQSDKVLITNLANYIQPFIRYELTDRIIVHNEPCRCGKQSHWLEIEGRTDDTLTFDNGIKIAPMSFYKILEEIKEISRFQLIQRTSSLLELRLTAKDRTAAFSKAQSALLAFLHQKEIDNTEIRLSCEEPQTDKNSGKFKHIYKNFSV